MSDTNPTRRRALRVVSLAPVFFGPGGSVDCVTANPPAAVDSRSRPTPIERQAAAAAVSPSPPAVSNWSVALACALWLMSAGAVMWFLHGGSEMRPVATQFCYLAIPLTLIYTVAGGAVKASRGTVAHTLS